MYVYFVTGKLTLKIPWKNLYTEPVIATIDGLYALAVPNVGELPPLLHDNISYSKL